MVLNLWDCGGQDAFYETYFSVQRGLIFRNVEVRPWGGGSRGMGPVDTDEP